jgi:TRAP-type transport system periplasmic protein
MTTKTHAAGRRSLLSIALAAAIAGGMLSALPAAAQTEIKFGHVGEPGSLFAASAEEFARRANAKLGNKAKVVVFGSSQLGGDKELLQKLKLGTVDIALPSTVMSSAGPVDRRVRDAVPRARTAPTWARIEKEIVYLAEARAGSREGGPDRLIGVWENGYRHITNNRGAPSTRPRT